MGEFNITGGHKLHGELKILGAKNSILPILAGTILNKGESIISNVPRLSDTFIALEILEHLDCTYTFEKDILIINSSNVSNNVIPIDLVQKMRSSIIFLGSLISLFGYCKICYPGGCKLGKRPIDLHLDNLKKLGVTILEVDDILICTANKIIGADLNLTFPSVGATENLILASVFCLGETNIINPAKEPEIIDLVHFLNSMGCNIQGVGTNCITIKGVSSLYNCEHKVVSDRIVAGTYLVAAAITDGSILLDNVNISYLQSTLDVLNQLGYYIRSYEKDNKVFITTQNKKLSLPLLETKPYPGFPTDMQSQFMALLCVSNGVSTIKETLFESRNMNVSELNKLGANIIIGENQTSIITGVNNLVGNTVYAKDLRGGASLIIAGLVASGVTTVKNSEHIERGYEDITRDLTILNGNITYSN